MPLYRRVSYECSGSNFIFFASCMLFWFLLGLRGEERRGNLLGKSALLVANEAAGIEPACPTSVRKGLPLWPDAGGCAVHGQSAVIYVQQVVGHDL